MTAIGIVVHYVLTAADAAQINRRRISEYEIGRREYYWPRGAQGHLGTPVKSGEHVPLMIVRMFPDGTVSGQATLDGTDVLWLQHIPPGTDPGTWHAPEAEQSPALSQ